MDFVEIWDKFLPIISYRIGESIFSRFVDAFAYPVHLFLIRGLPPPQYKIPKSEMPSKSIDSASLFGLNSY